MIDSLRMHLATAFSLWHSFELRLLIETGTLSWEGKVLPSHATVEDERVASRIVPLTLYETLRPCI